MTATALVVQPDGSTTVGPVETDLDSLKGIVGGWIEAVTGDDWHAYVNEEGRMLGLPVNPTATELVRQLGKPVDYLVGPVVFLGSAGSEDEDEGDVPEHVVAALG